MLLAKEDPKEINPEFAVMFAVPVIPKPELRVTFWPLTKAKFVAKIFALRVTPPRAFKSILLPLPEIIIGLLIVMSPPATKDNWLDEELTISDETIILPALKMLASDP